MTISIDEMVSTVKNSLDSIDTSKGGVSNEEALYAILTPIVAAINSKEQFSGSYNDLTDKPTIPNKVSDLENDSGFLTVVTSTDVTDALGFIPISEEYQPQATGKDIT